MSALPTLLGSTKFASAHVAAKETCKENCNEEAALPHEEMSSESAPDPMPQLKTSSFKSALESMRSTVKPSPKQDEMVSAQLSQAQSPARLSRTRWDSKHGVPLYPADVVHIVSKVRKRVDGEEEGGNISARGPTQENRGEEVVRTAAAEHEDQQNREALMVAMRYRNTEKMKLAFEQESQIEWHGDEESLITTARQQYGHAVAEIPESQSGHALQQALRRWDKQQNKDVSALAPQLFQLRNQDAMEDPWRQILSEHRAALRTPVVPTPRTLPTPAQRLGTEHESTSWFVKEPSPKSSSFRWPQFTDMFNNLFEGSSMDDNCMEMVLPREDAAK